MCVCSRSLEESVCKPVCLVFRNLCTMQEDNSGFSVLLDMLAELYQKQPKIGYHLLYYLKARYCCFNTTTCCATPRLGTAASILPPAVLPQG